MAGKRRIFAISGVKNSGKTDLITRLLPELRARGLKVAVLKHDGHDFEADVPGTDTCRELAAGACGTAVFSASKYMAVHLQADATAERLAVLFPEADLILLEGGKASHWPKIEVIRRGVSAESVCAGANLRAIATDWKPEELPGVKAPLLDLNDAGAIADFILSDRSAAPDGEGAAAAQETALHSKVKLVLSKEADFFGPGICRLLHGIDETGSIQAAAGKMNMSYSKAWKLVNRVERETGIRFLRRCNGGKNGGSSTLTEEGRRFLGRYETMLAELRRASREIFETYFGDYT